MLHLNVSELVRLLFGFSRYDQANISEYRAVVIRTELQSAVLILSSLFLTHCPTGEEPPRLPVWTGEVA